MNPLWTIVTILVLFVGAWFAFWLCDNIGFPNSPPAPPFAVILKAIIAVIFLCILLGMFGVFGPTWHPYLFPR